MDKDLQLRNLDVAYERGNYKSALKNEQFLSEAMTKEIKQGWILINSVTTTRHSATVQSTKIKQVSAWENWNSYLISSGIERRFLEAHSSHQQNIVVSTIAHVAHRANNRYDP